MSHEIENNTRFYSLRVPGWHNLGFVSDEVLSISDACIAADMDFDWSLHPVYTTIMDMAGIETIDVPGKFANVRTNKRTGERTAYGPVGEKFTNHTIPQIFGFVDELQGGGAVLETLGSLGRGERAFVTIKLPNTVYIGGKDVSNLYLFAATAFDGSMATTVDATAVRVVCANTWRAAKAASQGLVKIRHTSALDISDVEKARRILDLSLDYQASMEALGNKLLGTSLRQEDAAAVVAALFPFPESVKPGFTRPEDLSAGEKRAVSVAQEKRAQVFSLYLNSPAKAEEDTAWGLYNAVTEWADWFAPVRGDDKETARAEKVLLGGTEEVKDRALELLLV